ncbi:AAA family ATPase [Mesorhizobium sp.]|uniref:AAA family ATPase n=1 Tax=Mesorhizobium sp. TaxID=1871066 RepID=UPI00257B0BEE|nr:AAA family ATPase [Mesorhizobium sp.]
MTEHIYLTGIRLSQFRSFAALDIDLAPEPGVLIVHGSNGLGKSSLFDSLEWALSDSINHFRNARGAKKVGTYLCRWRENEAEPTIAAMTFSDGGIIERSLASSEAVASSVGGTITDIVGYLRAEQWTQGISALPHYLMLTHFLGQSTLSRFTHRDAAERFDILKEAAQSREIETIAAALHGRGNTVAVRAYARRAEAFDNEAAQYDDLLSREALLWEGVDGSGAIDDAAAFVLGQTILDLVDSAGKQTDPASTAPKQLLERLGDTKAELRDREAQFTQGQRLIQKWRHQESAQAECRSTLFTTVEQQSKLQVELTEALAKQADLDQQKELAKNALASARIRRDQLIGLQQARAARETLLGRQGDVIQALAAAEARLPTATGRVMRLDRRERIAARLEEEAKQLASEIDRQRTDINRIQTWLERNKAIATARSALDASEKEHPDIEGAIRQAKAEAAALDENVKAQADAVDALQQSTDSLANAITSIAAHLPNDSCECPVCATPFENAQLLHERVARAADRLAPALRGQEEALRALTRQHDTALEQLARLRAAQDGIANMRAEMAKSEGVHTALLDEIRHLVSSRSAAEAEEDLRKAVDQSVARRGRKFHWAARLRGSGPGDLAGLKGAAVREQDDARRQRDKAVSERGELLAGLDRANSEIMSIASRLDIDPEIGSASLTELFREADQRVDVTATKFETVRQAVDEINDRIRSLNAALAAIHGRHNELVRQQDALQGERAETQASWGELGFTGLFPNEDAVTLAASLLTVRGRDLAQAEDLLERLQAGRLAWSRQISHRAALDALRAAVDGAPNSEREELRAAAKHLRGDRLAKAAKTRETKAIAQAASNELLTELDEFNAEYIRPLDALMKRINQAILTDPRVGIDLQVNRKKIDQNAVKTGQVPAHIGEIDPMLVHSEGQMSALAVSMLCAASLTFPWSRWRALILDDPLQHNDAIHAAAFADLMGSLVREKGYQILLSTHDLAQAEFLQRKFAARGILCATLSLLGAGREGVETSFHPAQSQAPSAARA